MTPDEIRAAFARIDTVIFDIDGVLIDFSDSIRQVNLRSIPAYLRTLPGWTAPDDLLSSDDIEAFKRAGGFNDDWDLAYALALLFLHKSRLHRSADAAALHRLSPTVAEFTDAIARRGGWLAAAEAEVGTIDLPGYDPNAIRHLFQQMYAGDLSMRLYGVPGTGRGAVRDDKSLLDRSLVPANKTLAVLTGRTHAEAALALEMVGLADRIPLPAHGVTKDDGFYKPEPFGMRELVTRRLPATRVALYIGDSVDDLRTVLAFRTLPEAAAVTLLSAQVLTGPAGASSAPLFADADLVAPDVNAVLRRL